jgi:plastocyanin
MLRQGVGVLLALVATASPAVAADVAINTSGNAFVPDAVTVKAGDTVTVTNTASAAPHNLKWSDRAQAEMAPSSSWSSGRTFTQAGSFTFLCQVHSGMDGTVTVEAGTGYTWIGGTDSSWETAANWSPAGIPGTSPTDRATIAGAFVNMGGDHSLATLTLGSGAHRGGGGTLTLTGASTWTNGSSGPGKTIVAAGGRLTWNGGTLSQGEIENLGSLTVASAQLGHPLAGANPAVLDNQGTAVLGGTLTDGNPGQAVVQNPGTLSGSGTIGPPLSNSGLVRAQGGQLEVTGSVTPSPGDYEAAAGATLRFSGATTGEAGASVSGAGTVEAAGAVEFPSGDAAGWAVSGTTHVLDKAVLRIGGGTTGALFSEGSLRANLPFAVAGGTNVLSGDITSPAEVTVQGTTTLQSLRIWGSAKLRLQGPATLAEVILGRSASAAGGAPELLIAAPVALADTTQVLDDTGGGSPRVDVLAQGSLALGTHELTVQAPFTSAGTLGVQLDSASAHGKLVLTKPATLGGALAVTGPFKPADALRVITAPGAPAGSFASVTSGYEAITDATGVLVKTKPVAEPTASPTPSPTATAAPQPVPTPAPTVTPPFGTLVKLPACSRARRLRVTLLAPASVRVLLGRKQLGKSSKSFTLKRLPKRAFTLKFEVTLPDGRIVKASRRLRACRKKRAS